MQLKQLFADEDAVSPVIGVILMVAITVILAAVIGTFVLGLGENVQDSAPQANFQFEYTDFTASGGSMDVTHTGGEDVERSTVSIKVASTSVTPDDWSTTISTGDTESVTYTEGGSPSGGEDVRIIWTSPSGGNSNTIGTSTVPS